MGLLNQLNSQQAWQVYFQYKAESGNLSERLLEDLRSYIENREYEPVVQRILQGGGLSVPRKKLISKTDSQKKRVLYVFPREENYVLKLLTYLVIRQYDHFFSSHLYSFRSSTNSKEAIASLVRRPGISHMYSYKVDVSDYFGSIDIEQLLPLLKEALADDSGLFAFCAQVLQDPRVIIDDEIVEEKKGVIAGSPISTFFANVFLNDLDKSFEGGPYPYARYSDDIIVFAPTSEEIAVCEKRIKDLLLERSLSVNPKKESRTLPGEEWTFLGISYCDGIVDIAPVSAAKLKAKIRRKSRALLRWRAGKGIDHEYATKALVKSMNRKLFEGARNNDLTWTRWFFPLINTDKTLKELDAYFQDCLRYVATEKRTKARFNFRYEDMKRLGYRSLVHEYYAREAGQSNQNREVRQGSWNHEAGQSSRNREAGQGNQK